MKKICNELQPGFKRPANVWTERNLSVINAAQFWRDTAPLSLPTLHSKKNEPHNNKKKKTFLSFLTQIQGGLGRVACRGVFCDK